ncbi:hypothetical protein AMAG_04364 [Allomyces macrogynus ATCC 38327]|uniref:Cytochrome b5 heme-binding domain-containing protein n=1 Tax=Allomyces macrogynus (strain ATCC 38327) TaxID=578462 RepID=A0A0L0S889_ALLM3|nr:hypothetical protein AMAG_04364 [Allomyces macrogynus ATCC 38327]|eukprot:KNE58818.1 hypothetical protein AMAG_04364 [Allomyces macrogynus ATCC 38327]
MAPPNAQPSPAALVAAAVTANSSSSSTCKNKYARDKTREWQWADVKDAVENHGRILFVYKQDVYDVTAWAKNHPGGELALRHLNGKDATDQVRVFHPPPVLAKLPMYRAGTLAPAARAAPAPPLIVDPALYGDEPHQTYDASLLKPILDHPHLAPKGHAVHTMNHPDAIPLESAAFIEYCDRVVTKYRELDAEIRARGLYETRMSFYWLNLAKFVTLLGFTVYSVTQILSPASTGALEMSGIAYWSLLLVTAVALGMFWHQNAFVAHDAGHISVTRNYTADWTIGWILGNLTGGISIGWWKKSHNVHHIITNHPEHDPDIQHLPFFAISSVFLRNVWSSFHRKTMVFDAAAKVLVRVQHYSYYLIMAFARFNLYAQSFIYLATDTDTNKNRTIELTGLVLFWAWFGTLMSYLKADPAGLIVFVLLSHATTFLLHLQITLSHFAMSVHEVASHEPFPSRQLRTTMDIDCPTWLDWFHGGLQFQAIHHLFPRLPRTSFRAVRPLIMKFADDAGITYHHVPFIQGNGMMLSNFAEVARQIRIVFRREKLDKKGI